MAAVQAPEGGKEVINYCYYFGNTSIFYPWIQQTFCANKPWTKASAVLDFSALKRPMSDDSGVYKVVLIRHGEVCI